MNWLQRLFRRKNKVREKTGSFSTYSSDPIHRSSSVMNDLSNPASPIFQATMMDGMHHEAESIRPSYASPSYHQGHDPVAPSHHTSTPSHHHDSSSSHSHDYGSGHDSSSFSSDSSSVDSSSW